MNRERKIQTLLRFSQMMLRNSIFKIPTWRMRLWNFINKGFLILIFFLLLMHFGIKMYFLLGLQSKVLETCMFLFPLHSLCMTSKYTNKLDFLSSLKSYLKMLHIIADIWLLIASFQCCSLCAIKWVAIWQRNIDVCVCVSVCVPVCLL